MAPVKPELLAPAGNWECLRAAVANGADAVYFGLPRFNARLRADNFTEQDLPKVMDYLHQRGKRGFVAFNTLIFTRELPDAERQLMLLHQNGVDAAIIQDIGLAALARRAVPDFEVHASTQMTLTSPEGLRFARRLGVTRAVLARELSLREIKKISGESILPLEVFVHGALCVAYSGQCLTSEALGQRSANRGECAQACRLPYQLVVDGALKDLGDRRYLLSPQDLAAAAEIPDLVRLGIASFKIEGRLKSPEYVAAICQVYRKALDAAPESDTAAAILPSAADRYQMEMAFSRGLFSGWMHGVNHQKLVHARYGKKRGVYLGEVEKTGPGFFELHPLHPVEAGDGIVFENSQDTNREQGGRIFRREGNRFRLHGDKTDLSQIQPGTRVWKTDDPRLNGALRKSFVRDLEPLRTSLRFEAAGAAGQPLVLSVSWQGHTYSVRSSIPLQPAQRHPLTTAALEAQLARLGGTPFCLEAVENRLEGDVILPASELNRLRRGLIAQLPAGISEPPAPRPSVVREMLDHVAPTPSTPAGSPELTVLCRSLDQITAALDCGLATIYADFEDIRRYKEAVAAVRARGGARILLATPRIQKAGEQGFFKLIENAAPDGVLIRNLGALDHFRGSPLFKVGDFSLNIANPLAAALLKEEGLDRLTASYDLNAEQLADLLGGTPPGWFEITLHQHMPLFHMEHCVFAAFLSDGTDHTNCGRPCDRHSVQLRDRVGMDHPLKADVGCRNTVFHARPQSGAAFLARFLQAGAAAFRIELLTENSDQARTTLASYQQLLRNELTADELLGRLKAASQLGVTNGTLTVLAPS
jgi:putative protease